MTTIIRASLTQLSTSFIFMCILTSWVQTRSLFRDRRAFIYIANETACIVDNIIYHDGDPIPTDDPCESCKCRPPGFSCVLRECKVKPGCKAIRREGECCPEYQCGCEHNGKFFNDGDHIPNAESPCYSCYCQGSSITCALADCKFRFDCEPEYVPNECCPRYDHCQPETPFWTTTSKRPLITRITTMSTTASPVSSTETSPETSPGTSSTTSQPTSLAVTTASTSTTSTTTLTSSSTTPDAPSTVETSASPEISSPLSISTTINSISSTLSKDESVTISTQNSDKPMGSSSTSTITSEITSSSTTASPVIIEATTNKIEDEPSNTSPAFSQASTSDENTVTSSSVSPSTQTTNSISSEDKSDSLVPVSISVGIITTEKSPESNYEKSPDEPNQNEVTTMSSSISEASSETSSDGTSEGSLESSSEPSSTSQKPIIDVVSTPESTEAVNKVDSTEKANDENTMTTPSVLSSESDSNDSSPSSSSSSPSNEDKTEMTSISSVENNPEKIESSTEDDKKPDESGESKTDNDSEDKIKTDLNAESKTEEENSDKNISEPEKLDPVTTIVSNELTGETTTVGLEDNYLTTLHWLADSELRAEHKNGDNSDMIVDSDMDHHSESPEILISNSSEKPKDESNLETKPTEDAILIKINNSESGTTINPPANGDNGDNDNTNAPETFSEIFISVSNNSNNVSSNNNSIINVNNIDSETNSNINGDGGNTISTTLSTIL